MILQVQLPWILIFSVEGNSSFSQTEGSHGKGQANFSPKEWWRDYLCFFHVLCHYIFWSTEQQDHNFSLFSFAANILIGNPSWSLVLLSFSTPAKLWFFWAIWPMPLYSLHEAHSLLYLLCTFFLQLSSGRSCLFTHAGFLPLFFDLTHGIHNC